MQLGPLLTRSGLTHPEASSVVSPGSFCLLDMQFSIILGNLLSGILCTCCNQFLPRCVQITYLCIPHKAQNKQTLLTLYSIHRLVV